MFSFEETRRGMETLKGLWAVFLDSGEQIYLQIDKYNTFIPHTHTYSLATMELYSNDLNNFELKKLG